MDVNLDFSQMHLNRKILIYGKAYCYIVKKCEKLSITVSKKHEWKLLLQNDNFDINYSIYGHRSHI